MWHTGFAARVLFSVTVICVIKCLQSIVEIMVVVGSEHLSCGSNWYKRYWDANWMTTAFAQLVTTFGKPLGYDKLIFLKSEQKNV